MDYVFDGVVDIGVNVDGNKSKDSSVERVEQSRSSIAGVDSNSH